MRLSTMVCDYFSPSRLCWSVQSCFVIRAIVHFRFLLDFQIFSRQTEIDAPDSKTMAALGDEACRRYTRELWEDQADVTKSLPIIHFCVARFFFLLVVNSVTVAF
jgi:hypothetical protein